MKMELAKKEIKDFMVNSQDVKILDSNGNQLNFKVTGNNILYIDGKTTSWGDFLEMMIGSDYRITTGGGAYWWEADGRLKMRSGGSSKKWGGRRVPGPGKSLGRNPVNPEKKKKAKTFTLSPGALAILELMQDSTTNRPGGRKRSLSETLEAVIMNYYRDNGHLNL
jgi:hypothetical protein